MQKISIDNLGPIDGHFEMDLDKKLTILIGEQATGKSTIARFIAEQNEDCLYIPAGRAIIPLIFKSYAAATRLKIDPFMDKFILFVDNVRETFFDDYYRAMQNQYKSDSRINKNNFAEAVSLLRHIVKGECAYSNEADKDKIHVNKEIIISLFEASSGQQEIFYILFALLYVLSHPDPRTIIIEEPEAHLYPVSQKLVMELVARVINATGSRVIITTHSPYILTATNLLIHSAKVENKIQGEEAVVDPMARLNPDDVAAYLLERNGQFSSRSIIDEESGLIKAEEIDTVSDIIDEKMDDLVRLEVKHGL
ncbi:MAG: AAA family ATPase [Oscillospiraceae bacterium]|nr:AAA family ATPase [Oscillospiraceae bacterium]